MLISTETIYKLLKINNGQMCILLPDKMSAEEGTIELYFKNSTGILSDTSFYLYPNDNECSAFDNDGDEILTKVGTDAFDKCVNELLLENKAGLKMTMLEALNNEDLDLLESLINLL